MKQIIKVSTAVLAFAFIFAFYYYLTLGDLPVQTNNMVTTAKATVEQPCDCTNLSFLNGHLFAAPRVKPPLRLIDRPLVAQSPYEGFETQKSYAGISNNTSTSGTMALNAENTQAQNR